VTASAAGHRLLRHLREPQHRDATLLVANMGLAAAAGLVFWLVLTRALRVPADEVGVGYATIAVGTLLGVLAKGGLDSALVRTVPWASRRSAARLLRMATGIGCAAAVLATLALYSASRAGQALSPLTATGWTQAGLIGVLLVATWLQDAYFLAEGNAALTLLRTLAGSIARIALPVAIVVLGLGDPVVAAWAGSLAVALAIGLLAAARLPDRGGEDVPTPSFLASAGRNVAGSAAEFLPGLLLAPIVLATEGPAAAAYFGIAWTMASLLFLSAGAIGRSALAEMARPWSDPARAIRRAAAQSLLVLLPAAAGILLAPRLLGLFGAEYAAEGATAFMLLCASVLVVVPASLYLNVLRARERTLGLVVLPVGTIALLLALAPLLEAEWGLAGVAVAWILANTPAGLWSLVRLTHDARGVSPLVAQPLGGPPHLE
jgi:O-antigen/teichoic acid export membrane protein